MLEMEHLLLDLLTHRALLPESSATPRMQSGTSCCFKSRWECSTPDSSHRRPTYTIVFAPEQRARWRTTQIAILCIP